MPSELGFPKDEAEFRKMYPHAPCGRVLQERHVESGHVMAEEVRCGSLWCMHPYAGTARKSRKTRRRRTTTR